MKIGNHFGGGSCIPCQQHQPVFVIPNPVCHKGPTLVNYFGSRGVDTINYFGSHHSHEVTIHGNHKSGRHYQMVDVDWCQSPVRPFPPIGKGPDIPYPMPIVIDDLKWQQAPINPFPPITKSPDIPYPMPIVIDDLKWK